MIRFGIIGTNWITEKLLQSVNIENECELSAVYSRSEDKAKEFASKYNVTSTFTSVEEMAKSRDIDAVYIASPNSLHSEHAISLLKHGKHVLCEKPLASNTAEVQNMFSVAKENNVVLMEAMKTTLLPNFQVIQENLYKIGKIRRYTASYCQYSSRYDAYKKGTILNAFNPSFSNGSLMDLGIYCIYPMVVLFGQPQSVKATAVFLESGVDGEGSVIMQYEDMDAVIMYSKITNSSLPSEIQGEEGCMVIRSISELEKVEIQYKDGSVEDISIPREKDSMFYEVQEFVGLIKRGQLQSKVNSYQHSLMTATILEQVRKEIGLVYPADKKS